MATVNKNFVVKNGLVVQGSTATINGNNILTENSADSYILNLIGGETLVKSVDSLFNVDNDGNLTFNYGSGLSKSSGNLVIDRSTVDTWYDASGAASTAESNANTYTDGAISSALNTFGNQTASDISDAITTAENYTDSAISQEVTDRNSAISSAISTEVSDRNSAIATAKSEAISTASSDATSKANTAEQNAKNYADGLASNYDAAGSATNAYNNALADANEYTDGKVSDLVNSAPALLDTLGELAAALQNNPDIITNLQDVASGKQDTLTAGEGIYIDNDNVITGRQQSGGGLKFVFNEAAIDRSTVDGWYDAAGAAATAQSNAESYADNAAEQALYSAQSYADTAASNAQSAAETFATNAANNAESNANSYTDDAISNGNSNATPTYAGINLGWVAKDFANYQWIANDSQTTVATWPLNYATAKLTVHLRNGVHSQASEVLIARDSSNNIHMTEYAIVTTNGILGDVTATVLGSDILLKVTPTYATGTDVAVKGSALVWAD